MITLDINGMYIDIGKNRGFVDHSVLFQPTDLLEIPYYYADNYVEEKEGFQRSLAEVCQRLDLLGFSEHQLNIYFQDNLEEWLIWESGSKLSFDTFKHLLANVDLTILISDQKKKGLSFCEAVSSSIFNSDLAEILPAEEFDHHSLTEFLEYLNPYLILRLLALNATSQNLIVEWRFSDIVENGWVERDEIVHELEIKHKIMIITEGTTDVFVLKRTIEELYPAISDFFYFIDMEKNYPFKGAGSLANFCMGLAKLQIQNKILVIFDNDVAGNESFAKLSAINKPSNIHFMKLPELPEFNNIPTVGPSGESVQDINGSAVAIESFLDESKLSEDLKKIRWTSYNAKQNKYQGELEGKNDIHDNFKAADLKSPTYNTAKLESLVDHILQQLM